MPPWGGMQIWNKTVVNLNNFHHSPVDSYISEMLNHLFHKAMWFDVQQMQEKLLNFNKLSFTLPFFLCQAFGKHDEFSCINVNKQLLDEAVFRDIQNYQGRGKCPPKPKAETDNTYRDLDYSGYHEKPNSIIVLLYIESLK